jgi:hypothetical protein
MKNNALYIQLKQLAITGDYTLEQLDSLTHQQAQSLLGGVVFSVTFFHNMKHGIKMALEARNEEREFQQVKGAVKSWLDANFPEWVAEKGKDGNKPIITFWLKGKP